MRTSNLSDTRIAAPRHLALTLLGRAGVLLGASVLGLSCSLVPSAFAASKTRHTKVAPEIIAEGHVINHAKVPVNNAIVYLEDPKSLAVKSYLTDNNGHFHFNQLLPQTDYEIWAEQNGVQSKHKFISQFSSHTEFKFTLELDPAHKHKLLGFL